MVGLQAGAALRHLCPNPRPAKNCAPKSRSTRRLRPDLGIHGAVHYLFRVLRGDVRVGSQTAARKAPRSFVERRRRRRDLRALLGPFMAFFIGGLWGIYATQYGVQRTTRLLMGAVFGGATAKSSPCSCLYSAITAKVFGISSWHWRFRSACSAV